MAVIILDSMLLDARFLGILNQLRKHAPEITVLVLPARDPDFDNAQAPCRHADACTTKQVDVSDLITRANALCGHAGTTARLSGMGSGSPEYRFGSIVVDSGRRTIRCGNAIVEVRPMEFDLLIHLLQADGQVVSRHVLLQKVWHYRPDVATRTLDQHISRLRHKLEDDPANPRHIITVRKTGYRFVS